MKTVPDASHPVWSLLRVLGVVSLLTVVLVCTAKDFDETELRTIGIIFASLAVGEGALSFLLGKGGK